MAASKGGHALLVKEVLENLQKGYAEFMADERREAMERMAMWHEFRLLDDFHP